MKLRYRFSILLALLSSALTGNRADANPAEQPSNRQRGTLPNILLISADDLGFSDIGCYGSEIQTPNLDALAAQGIRMTQLHNTAKSFPSRSCLLTGLYAQQNGYAYDAKGPLENCVTLGEYLQTAGYITLWAGKHHGAENPKTRGFDHFWGLRDGACNYFNPGCQRDGEGVPAQKVKNRYWCIEDQTYAPYTPKEKDFYTTDYFTNHALEWLDEYKDSNQPVFLYLAFNAPHDPLMAWPEDIAKYRGKYHAGYEAVREARFRKQRAIGLIDDRYALTEPTHKPWSALNDEERAVAERKMEVYAAMIDRMDQNIGRVVKRLKEQGKYENTLIIFVSDNGASAENVRLKDSYGEIGTMTCWTSLGEDWANVCNTPFRYYKNYSYEGGICAPMILCWPSGISHPGRNSDYLAHFIDIMATFVDLTGAPYPKEYSGRDILPYEGVSLMPVIEDGAQRRESPLYWAWKDGRAVRSGKWKIVKHGLENDWSLYDMLQDPAETADRSSEYPHVVKRLSAMFDEWFDRVSIGQQDVSLPVTVCGEIRPDRMDDLAWENEYSGYRAFGPYLKKKGDPSYGYDIFTKSVTWPVLHDRYDKSLGPEKISYHIDHGDGMDAFAVGPTLGCGTAALVDHSGIVYPWCWEEAEIIENGPKRFRVQLTYSPIMVDGQEVIEHRLITLDSGSRLNRVDITYDGLDRKYPIVVGIVVHEENPTAYFANDTVIATADLGDRNIGQNGEIYCGAMLPQGFDSCAFHPFDQPRGSAIGHVLGYSTYQPGKSFTYWFGSGWSKGGINGLEEWVGLIRNNNLSADLK